MDIRSALKEQYHAGLAMLKECVELCPDDLWTAGKHPRTYWRIAFHAAYFAHLYLGQSEDAYVPWPGRKEGFPTMWERPWDIEPYELPENAPIYRPEEIIDYILFVDGRVDPCLDAIRAVDRAR